MEIQNKVLLITGGTGSFGNAVLHRFLDTDNFDTYKNTNLKGTNNYAHGTFYSDVVFGNILIYNQITPNFKMQNLFSIVSKFVYCCKSKWM